ncbi:MAG: hypothetical protein A2406_02285 [Candidatus Komeilibacteria bacterium RIFOXYC1_FULL_37_11]|uniref:Uncharacterized protein n=1 Tax=Candidatus Komeilibacteria bacterium RIFOXYC1_FULL_37_11 TaxID=1798555 RepID=A0A1G2BZQ4_9BACT|nr:MAG: hypothetical protein A2406_02285 [Candidatus Komeilibacteria bacterium RIFOXYC1_FULL_37_11]OGY95515.1 MAG: hypothetical protein A2611_02340 [Candidatus Komeilibacteria bacterium RIFOXYD1_FULL_37_29]OGY96401.1 MAG: hypothetical protein A2543_00150 [Candidatus Komeilibacteria bacterium RIFOXYD2_FULL_37_8]
MPPIKSKATQDKIAEIQQIRDLALLKLGKLKDDKNKIISQIIQRVDEEKISQKLQELKDRY